MDGKLTCEDCEYFDLKKKFTTHRCGKGRLTIYYDPVCRGYFTPRGGLIMDNIKVKYGTHMVFKIGDLEEALSQEELQQLWDIKRTVKEWREEKGKSTDGYLVVNRDEPYAGRIQVAILSGERSKKLDKMFEELLQALNDGIFHLPTGDQKVHVFCTECDRLIEYQEGVECPHCHPLQMVEVPEVTDHKEEDDEIMDSERTDSDA